jgi:hypothetical protein
MASYVLAPAYSAIQFWNSDKSDLVEIRRPIGQETVEVPSDIPSGEAKRLLDLGAIVEAGKQDASESPGEIEEPAANAGREKWAAYADSLGLTVEPGSDAKAIKQQIADSRS